MIKNSIFKTLLYFNTSNLFDDVVQSVLNKTLFLVKPLQKLRNYAIPIILTSALGYVAYKAVTSLVDFEASKLPRPNLPPINYQLNQLGNQQLNFNQQNLAIQNNPPIIIPPHNIVNNVQNHNFNSFQQVLVVKKTHPYSCHVRARYLSLKQVTLPGKLPNMPNDMQNILLADSALQQQYNVPIHIPTVDLACSELTPYMEEVYRHLKINFGEKLCSTERSYFFGLYVIPKILTHLTTFDKFQYHEETLNETAHQIIYTFLNNSHRILPFMPLGDKYDADDITNLEYRIKQHNSMLSFRSLDIKFNDQLTDFTRKIIKGESQDKHLFQPPVLELAAQNLN